MWLLDEFVGYVLVGALWVFSVTKCKRYLGEPVDESELVWDGILWPVALAQFVLLASIRAGQLGGGKEDAANEGS